MSTGPEGGRFAGDPYVARGGQSAAAPIVIGIRPYVAYADAKLVAGQLVATLGPPRNGTAWEVRRITVQASALAVNAYVYVGGPVPQNLVSGTSSGHFDENDTNQPIFVPENVPMSVAWSTATGTASVRIEYLEV